MWVGLFCAAAAAAATTPPAAHPPPPKHNTTQRPHPPSHPPHTPQVLPRHMQIVYDINWRFLQEVRAKYGDDWARIGRMSIIEEAEGGEK